MNEKFYLIISIIILILTLNTVRCSQNIVDPLKTIVWGPGLRPDLVVLPARYFFVHAVNREGHKFKESPPLTYSVIIHGSSPLGKCRYSADVIDRGDGSSIIRYKIVDMCQNVEIEIKYNGSHVAESPYFIRGNVYSEECYCPQTLSTWMSDNECSKTANRIDKDLQPFKQVNFSSIRDIVLKKFDMPGSVSICNYVVKDNEVYRKCIGKYTGFKMFMDAILLSLARIVQLPDMEFFLNLGDWPLLKKDQQKMSASYPIFSWCGSDDTYDIVLPTYDITESTLENMGRVMLDMLSVQRIKYHWEDKEEKAFWRGRDARRERLDLIDLGRKYPDLFNVSLTNFFFFRDEEEKYGPKSPHISFLDFFKYKYQINIDGTVAAYRFPYLLGGNSVVLKQNSPFYEYFYDKLIPNKHYIPFKRDLSDLVNKIKWAKANDAKVKEIVENARDYVEKNLLPINIYCYHVQLFEKWSKRLVSPIIVLPDMEKVKQEKKCSCTSSKSTTEKDEL